MARPARPKQSAVAKITLFVANALFVILIALMLGKAVISAVLYQFGKPDVQAEQTDSVQP